MTRRASLVPVFSFGETEIYDQVENPEVGFLPAEPSQPPGGLCLVSPGLQEQDFQVD